MILQPNEYLDADYTIKMLNPDSRRLRLKQWDELQQRLNKENPQRDASEVIEDPFYSRDEISEYDTY